MNIRVVVPGVTCCGNSFIKSRNNIGPRTVPCGTPDMTCFWRRVTIIGHPHLTITVKGSYPGLDLASYVIIVEFPQ